MTEMACEGWWEQNGLGRQPMHNLQIAFDGGKIAGSGTDVIGPFTLMGQLEGEKTLIHKQYIDAHSVEYPGSFDGEGTMQGLWSIHGFGGKWLIRVVDKVAAGQRSSAAKDIDDWNPPHE